jgi:hypothetical protein
MRVIALFNLKPEVSPDEYLAFARELDLPTVNALPSIDSFRLFRSTGLLFSEDAPPYSYVEILDINDMDQFGRDASSEVMQDIAAKFQGMADVIFLSTEEITA